MPDITLDLPHHSYAVTVEPGALTRLAGIVRDAVPSADKVVLVTDEGVEPHHGRRVAKALQDGGIDTSVAVIPVSEKKKTLGTVRNLYEILLENKLERGHAVVTLGGGICCDVAGFAAATYLRGVAVVQCPTTLLAMVDASVGGKTGVNVPQGKNLIGSFHQPAAVVCDPQVLGTLPERELRCGLAECIKHGVIRDPELFDWIGANAPAIAGLDEAVLVELILRTRSRRPAGLARRTNTARRWRSAWWRRRGVPRRGGCVTRRWAIALRRCWTRWACPRGAAGWRTTRFC